MATYAITGGTGTLGRLIARRLLSDGHAVRAIARNEQGHLRLMKFIGKALSDKLSHFIGDVRDPERLARAFSGADYVIHAAAMKVVPLCEYNPADGVKTNIIGTMNVVNACLDRGVKRAVFISSDKACHPSTTYGAQKFASERLWLASNRYAGEDGIFTAVRYGNCWGSAGSILHTMTHQAQTAEVTITDERCTRFHLKMKKAVDIVRYGLNVLSPGELFVPKLPSYRILDVVDVIAPKAARSVIGLRASEKIHESMVSEDESEWALETDDGFIIDPTRRVGKRFDYNSGSNTWRVSKQDLEADYKEWLSDEDMRSL